MKGRSLAWCLAGAAFALLATANAAGYRYGVSDQAFYIPVVMRALDPAAFPRDAALIDAQGRLMAADEALAWIVRVTGLPLDVVFFAGYLLSLGIIWAGLVRIGSHLYRSAWVTTALGAAFTLRHRIPETSANSFEPYFHPRMLAFGLGVLAVAALLRRRRAAAVALVAAAAIVHVTTAIWFAVLIGTALAVLEPRLRRAGAAAAVAATAGGIWAVTVGPLRASLTTMDTVWLDAVATKDSLFADQWPPWAWAANLGMLALLWWVHIRRRHRGEARDEDAAIVWGATALVAIVLLTLPLVAWRLALPVQLQITRAFWLIDFLATTYVLALASGRRPEGLRLPGPQPGPQWESQPGSQTPGPSPAVPQPYAGAPVQRPVARPPSPDGAGGRWRVPAIVALALLAISTARGVYIMTIERPERPLFAIHLPQSPWRDAMAWISRQPVEAHVLADPGHGWKYDVSVRVAAGRDVFLEEVKDSAIAIYSRDVAARVVERTQAIGDFPALTAERARELAARYGLHYLVTEADLPLPAAYRNTQFRIYRLDSATGDPPSPREIWRGDGAASPSLADVHRTATAGATTRTLRSDKLKSTP